MNESDNLLLKWNEFQLNISSTFNSLREDLELSDVTLVCEDGQQLEAHKIILLASSSFFLNLFKRNKHANPLIFMRGMKYQDLRAVVDFIYQGEVNIHEDNLNNFLTIAEDLNLKGLAGSLNDFKGTNNLPLYNTLDRKESHEQKDLVLNPIVAETLGENQMLDSFVVEGVFESVPEVPVFGPENLQELDWTIKSMGEMGNTLQSDIMKPKIACEVCGKEGTLKTIRDHIDQHHIKDIVLPCGVCGQVFKTKSMLRMHTLRMHELGI